jgi:hypothetical protein
MASKGETIDHKGDALPSSYGTTGLQSPSSLEDTKQALTVLSEI